MSRIITALVLACLWSSDIVAQDRTFEQAAAEINACGFWNIQEYDPTRKRIPRRPRKVVIPSGSTFYSNYTSASSFIREDYLTDYIADLNEIRDNVRALEAVLPNQTYPYWAATQWTDYVTHSGSDPSPWLVRVPPILSFRVDMDGPYVPGGVTYLTDAINRARVYVLGLPAITDWGFDPSDTSQLLLARDNMQKYLGAPLERSVPAGGGSDGSNYVYAIHDSDGDVMSTNIYVALNSFESRVLASLKNHAESNPGGPDWRWWHTLMPLPELAQPTDTEADSYFGFTLNKQLVLLRLEEVAGATQPPAYVEIRTGLASTLTIPYGPSFTTFYNNSISASASYSTAAFQAIQVGDITAGVASWMAGGLPADGLMAFWSPIPYPPSGPRPEDSDSRYSWRGDYDSIPGSGHYLLFWGVDE